ncbi:MAG: methyltransferase domain-containing protein [Chlorobiaceae bacterium]|nr:methyltransferase domain-containing protein [Chlorobiaceae bacterium]
MSQNIPKQQIDYAAFEACFRGSRQEIKIKQSIYLPLVKQLSLGGEHPALDIGCGRGEWLELLQENNIQAEGVDSNTDFVESCKKIGLPVFQADVFDFFSNSEKKQYNLITGFHIFEHIPAENQLVFLHNIFSLLAPGGVLILETPNPENVTVGSCNFYIDPTHIRPIPPQLAAFLALEAGFVSPIIARVNRYTVGNKIRLMPESIRGAEIFNQLAEMFTERILQAPDYALIAFKPPVPSDCLLQSVRLINEENQDCIIRPDSREALIASLEQKVKELQEKSEELVNVQSQLRQKEAELNSVYKTAAGQFIRFYKSLKKKNKRSKNKGSDINEHPESVKKTYKKLLEFRS